MASEGLSDSRGPFLRLVLPACLLAPSSVSASTEDSRKNQATPMEQRLPESFSTTSSSFSPSSSSSSPCTRRRRRLMNQTLLPSFACLAYCVAGPQSRGRPRPQPTSKGSSGEPRSGLIDPTFGRGRGQASERVRYSRGERGKPNIEKRLTTSKDFFSEVVSSMMTNVDHVNEEISDGNRGFHISPDFSPLVCGVS